MPDTNFWKRKVGELGNKKLTIKEQLKNASGKEKERLEDQMTIIQMDLDRAQEILNQSRRGISDLAR